MHSTLGIIDEKRLEKIKPEFRPGHEFCFHLHDSMLSMFLELASYKYPTVRIDFDSVEDANRFHEAGDPITFFLESGQRDIAKTLSVGQAMMAIWSDFFNFIYEALIALEKRKFVVAFSLLRKPLKENLLYLTMILVDDDKFFEKLENSPAEGFGHPGIQDTHRKVYFTKAKSLIPFGEFVDPEVLHDMIFNVGTANGLAPLFDKATHLVTNRKQIQTENLNLNFIFKNPTDDDIHQSIYGQLSYILLYAMLLEIELFRKAGFNSDKLASWFSLTGMGAYSALFIKGRCKIAASMNRLLKDFLVCPHCGESVRIRKSEAARFFTVHKITCRSCHHEHDFPLFWLMSKVDWSLKDDKGGVSVSEDESET